MERVDTVDYEKRNRSKSYVIVFLTTLEKQRCGCLLLLVLDTFRSLFFQKKPKGESRLIVRKTLKK